MYELRIDVPTLQLLSRSPLVLANTHHSSYRGLRVSGSFLFAVLLILHEWLASLTFPPTLALQIHHAVLAEDQRNMHNVGAPQPPLDVWMPPELTPLRGGGSARDPQARGWYRYRRVLRWCQLVATKPLCAFFSLTDFFGPIFRQFNSDPLHTLRSTQPWRIPCRGLSRRHSHAIRCLVKRWDRLHDSH